ncbi:MarR family transcriptional regulator [Agromyces sp. H66]|uniref:MarR family winged helix-turn-helix transcriptional regulator n=1 Tax=Agromyces sp. H66 TaxID=2529859 RepID=UPI0010A9DF31|nr:MarR family transcriptional regulator [Agromyces sp. H66]
MATDRGLIYLIKQVELGVRRPFMEVVNVHGMNFAQYTALTVLFRLPGLTSSELARRSFVRAQTMAETITVLIDGGLVRREPDPDHGRQMLLYITDAGIARISAMADDVRAVEDDMLRELTDEEVDQFRSYLRRCRDALRSPSARIGTGERSGA